MSNILEVQNVVKQYGDYTALNNVSLQVPKGSIYGLLGPNGAGKTSLIRIINQITMPDSGVVFLDGEKLHPDHVKHIGYMPEERGLYKTMKVGEQCLYLAQLKGMPEAEAKKQLKYWFEKFEIQGWWDKKIQELSKGMAQKIQFIVTVLHQPKLLILDEPTNHLDLEMIEWLEDYFAKENITLFMVTHDRFFLERVCNEIIELDNGKIYQYKGNYSYYLEKKEERLASENASIDKAQNLFVKDTGIVRICISMTPLPTENISRMMNTTRKQK